MEAAFRAGADWLQIRDRSLPGAALLTRAEDLAAAARRGASAAGRSACILVNRRLDIALAMHADGVPLGFDAVSPEDARRVLGKAARIGVSVHAPAECRAAAQSGASYVHLAPIYPPLSKRATRPALGPTCLREAATAGIPVIAQGGVTPRRCAELIQNGASGVAVTGAIVNATDPKAATAAIRSALDATRVA